MILNAIGIEAGERRWKVFHLRRRATGFKAERTFTLEGDWEQMAAGLREYAEKKRPAGMRLCIALAPGSYMTRTIELPPAEGDSLRGVLAFELEKHLPSEQSGWAYSFEILKAGPEKKIVFFSAAPSETVERTIHALRGAGFPEPLLTTAERAIGKALSHSRMAPAGGAVFLSLKGSGAHVTAWAGPERPCYSRSFKAAGKPAWRAAFDRELRLSSIASEGKLSRCFIVCEEGGDMPQAEEARAAARSAGLKITECGEVPAVSAPFGAALLLLDRKGRSCGLAPKRDGAFKAKGAALAAAGGALGLALLLPAFFLVNEALTLRKLDRALSELGPEKGKAQALQSALAALEADIRVFREVRGEDAPGFLEVLRRLTEATPSDTYLTGMEYDRDTVSVEGASRKASRLFMALERSGLARDLEFDGPVTAGTDGRERFRIKLRLNRVMEAGAHARQ